MKIDEVSLILERKVEMSEIKQKGQVGGQGDKDRSRGVSLCLKF